MGRVQPGEEHLVGGDGGGGVSGRCFSLSLSSSLTCTPHPPAAPLPGGALILSCAQEGRKVPVRGKQVRWEQGGTWR